ncbi:MAG: hypothetical protein IPJ71_02480 [Bdellovibrionales bacterium]|nr:hypothetical protein [Bdellovibrionales bacterium]
MLFCLLGTASLLTTARAIAGPGGDYWIDSRRAEPISEKDVSTCRGSLAGTREDHPLVVSTHAKPDKATSLRMTRRPDVPTPSGYLKSWEELNKFIENNELRFWVEEGKKYGNHIHGSPDHFVNLIGDYRDSVNNILLQGHLDQGQILKILYYNISSVSSELIPVEWSRSSSELNYFLSDQLQLLRYILGNEIVAKYEMIRVDPRFHGTKGSEARSFVDSFQDTISPLLHPRFGVRIVFQTCQLLYDLMLDQRYFKASKYKLDISLHKLLQDALLRIGTHPYVLLHFWAKEPRLLMDQDFPSDGFWFRRSGVFKNLPQSKRRLKSLVERVQPNTLKTRDLFLWREYDERRFDPDFVLSFGSEAKYEKINAWGEPKEKPLLEYLKMHLEINHVYSFSRALGTSVDYFGYQLRSTGPWSESLSGHASALSLFLLQAARDERLLKFGLQISTSISAEDYEFLDYVTSRNSDSISRIARNLDKQRKPSRTREFMRRFSEYFARLSSLAILGSLDSQEVEPLLLENDRAQADASITLYKTPPLPDLGAVIDVIDVIDKDTSTPDDDTSPQFEVQKLGTAFKQLAQEIETIYGWVMNVEFGIGNLIGYSRSWPEISSMINPDHLGEMINRLSYDLDVLVHIQNRMISLNEDSQAEEALAFKRINRTFAHSNIFNLIQFTKSLLENLEIIQHAMKVHHPSRLVPINSDNLAVIEEMSKISQNLRELPSLLQRPSASASPRK